MAKANIKRKKNSRWERETGFKLYKMKRGNWGSLKRTLRQLKMMPEATWL